jgi:CheY-like chemotaxis protein
MATIDPATNGGRFILRGGIPSLECVGLPLHAFTRGVCPIADVWELSQPGGVSISVLIVDDHPPFRQTASELLRARGFDVVGQAANLTEAIAEVRRLRPDVVLLDVHLPDADGIDAVHEFSGAGAGSRVLLTSTDPDATTDEFAKQHGAVGFVAKTELVTVDLAGYFR